MQVWKYPLDLREYQTIEMPMGAELLTFQTQNDVATLWALVNETQNKTTRLFRIAGTGNPIDDKIKSYVGTVQMQNGLVWHLFEIE